MRGHAWKFHTAGNTIKALEARGLIESRIKRRKDGGLVWYMCASDLEVRRT